MSGVTGGGSALPKGGGIDSVAGTPGRSRSRNLLSALASHAGKVLTHQQLFHEVWRGRDHGDAQQYLRVYVANLRRKLEKDPVRPEHIFTVSGVGYRFGA